MLKIDRYDVIDQIGRGRLGNVYRALHPDIQKYVVIKEIISDLASNASVKARFEQEVARLMQMPAHPNVVAVRDGLVLNNRLYLVMDYVDGGSLAGLQRGILSPQQTAGLMMQMLSGLEAIHARGLIHNNLKPGNILLNTEGTALISDISITERVFGGSDTRGVFNPKYAAPELIDASLGRSGNPEQIDIYAVGMLAYEMLLGEEDFRRAFPDIYNAKAGDELKRWLNWHTGLSRSVRNLSQLNSNIPNPLAHVIERMMAKDVNQRYKNSSEAKRDLAAWLHPTDVRRRADKPDDDATVPIQHLRDGGAKPNQPGSSQTPQYPQYPAQQYPQQNYGNAPNQGYYQQPPAPQPPPGGQPPPNWQMQQQAPVSSPAPPSENKRGLPFWLLLGAGGLFGIIVIAVVLFLLNKNPGLTLIITGAPAGSDVFITDARGELRRGVPIEGGYFRVGYLKPGTHTILVRCSGYADFPASVDGKDGEEKIVSVVMTRGECTLPPEITYKGHVLVLICAGDFTMGSNSGEGDEKPAHQLNLPDYYIDKYEVSNQKYREFCEATSTPTPTPFQFYKDLFEKNPTCAVVGISWFDAKKYAEWRGLRLPTEAEWEKAASWDPKSKTKRIYPWGDTRDETRGKFGSQNLAPVDSFSNGVSAYGVFNMAGNAAEWVEDAYKPYPGAPSSEGFDPSLRIARGGSVANDLNENKARTSYRSVHKPDEVPFINENDNERKVHRTALGFRCAVAVTDPGVQEVIRAAGRK